METDQPSLRIIKPEPRKKIQSDTNLYLEYSGLEEGAEVLAIFLGKECVASGVPVQSKLSLMDLPKVGKTDLTVALMGESGQAVPLHSIRVQVAEGSEKKSKKRPTKKDIKGKKTEKDAKGKKKEKSDAKGHETKIPDEKEKEKAPQPVFIPKPESDDSGSESDPSPVDRDYDRSSNSESGSYGELKRLGARSERQLGKWWEREQSEDSMSESRPPASPAVIATRNESIPEGTRSVINRGATELTLPKAAKDGDKLYVLNNTTHRLVLVHPGGPNRTKLKKGSHCELSFHNGVWKESE